MSSQGEVTGLTAPVTAGLLATEALCAEYWPFPTWTYFISNIKNTKQKLGWESLVLWGAKLAESCVGWSQRQACLS